MVERLLKLHESKTLEFKESLESPSGILKAITAFANTAGGTIVIGVEDKTKKVIGVKDVLMQEERLSDIIYESIAPDLMPDIEICTYGKKELIIIRVSHGVGPYYIKSLGMERGTYVRLGSTNRRADAERLRLLQYYAQNVTYDELPCPQATLADVDWDIVKNLFSDVHKKFTVAQAQSLGFITKHGSKECPSAGAVILFGKDRLRLFPQARIRCARFLGIEKRELLDQLDIEVYLPLALEEVIKFVRRNTRMRFEIKDLAPRKEIAQYPPLAVREAILNAIIHTDYAQKGGYISVIIFDDRIEITNPGGLPFGLTMERALAGASRIRNRVIAKLFYQLKWVEQWGLGLGTIFNECEQRGLKRPKIEELGDEFRVTLYEAQEKRSSKKRVGSADLWQDDVVSYLKKKKKIRTHEVATLWDITPRAARLRLLKLIEAGVIIKMSNSVSDPQGVYVLA